MRCSAKRSEAVRRWTATDPGLQRTIPLRFMLRRAGTRYLR
jgi:hypothetical protein